MRRSFLFVELSGKKSFQNGGVVIYFIQDSEVLNIKVGFTASQETLAAEVRRKQLQTGNPSLLVVLASMPGTEEDEGRLHKQFHKHRVGGEWFRPVPDLLKLIVSVGGKDADGQSSPQFAKQDDVHGRKVLAELNYQFGSRTPEVALKYSVDSLVRHREYGVGKVTRSYCEYGEEYVVVRFPAGEKKFQSAHVRFELIRDGVYN